MRVNSSSFAGASQMDFKTADLSDEYLDTAQAAEPLLQNFSDRDLLSG